MDPQKKLATCAGIDPAEFRAQGKSASADETDVVALRAGLAAEKAARATSELRAEATQIKDNLFRVLELGGRPAARDFVVGLGDGAFKIENG